MAPFRRLFIAVACFLLATTPGLAQLDREQLATIEEEIQAIRGLELLEPINVRTMSPDAYRQQTIDSLDQDYAPADRIMDQRILVAFGLLEPEDDLGEAYISLLGGSVAGYYDPSTGEMVIITFGGSDDLSAFDQVTYAHEAVHAMQDQHFDLTAILNPDHDASGDELLAGRSLIEGDATVAEIEYLLSDLSLARNYLFELENMNIDSSGLDQVPDYLTRTLLFPYSEGYEFVQFLFDEGGWDLVNASYANPPVSTEQILHPELYLAGEMPVSVSVGDVSSAIGPEWTEVDNDVVGEFIIRLMLENSDLSDAQVDRAASGWGGDAYSIIATSDELAITWQTVWDTDQDAAEFFRAMGVRESVRINGEVVTNGNVVTIEGDGVVVRLMLDGDEVTYLQAPTLVLMEMLLGEL